MEIIGGENGVEWLVRLLMSGSIMPDVLWKNYLQPIYKIKGMYKRMGVIEVLS